MQLYYTPGACSLAPHIVFKWLKVPYTLLLADKSSRVFQQASPMLTVPTLVVDGMGSLTQCGAILRYQTTLPGGEIYGPNPNDPLEVYEFDHWECFLTGDMHPSFFPFFSPQRYTTDDNESSLASVRAAAVPLVEKVFTVLDRHLSEHDFIVGGRISIIDAYVTPMLRWAKMGLPDTCSKYPHVMRHYQMMCENNGVKSAMTQQNISA
ncbi:glutathione S-transferase family protein [Pseudomonas fluorescens]|uniref:glutathione S-transferase family protein n=1 Tax=Pseudomonas fluorescens TaxID=294 RepID=UPI000CD151B3|nr:glutathione S-transferase family protein [Pseudomonas fluorescens]PNY78741.1 glutathione S-transferase [Pseudomonas fluorescens]